ncbi:MAG: hypothetical protein AAGF98_05920 [Cyanobacteria bacterium P01_H01_bin.153]
MGRVYIIIETLHLAFDLYQVSDRQSWEIALPPATTRQLKPTRWRLVAQIVANRAMLLAAAYFDLRYVPEVLAQ